MWSPHGLYTSWMPPEEARSLSRKEKIEQTQIPACQVPLFRLEKTLFSERGQGPCVEQDPFCH